MKEPAFNVVNEVINNLNLEASLKIDASDWLTQQASAKKMNE